MNELPQNSSAIKVLQYCFLLTVAIMPAISLLWNRTFFSIQYNWALFLLFLFGLAVLIVFRRRITIQFVVLLAAALFYAVLAFFKDGNMPLLFRIWFTLVPLTLVSYFRELPDRTVRIFWIFSLLAMLPVLYSVFLQIIGELPYYTFDRVDGVNQGRLSGGYEKPMNLITFLLPWFICGLYLWVVQRRVVLGMVITVVVLAGVVYIGHRTSSACFLAIFAAAFARRWANAIVIAYYRYLGPFWIGVMAFALITLFYYQVGLVEGLRGRVPMWMLHGDEFWNGSFFNILFGRQIELLDSRWVGDPRVWSLDEVHNNSFRTIVFFGLAGYLGYCLLMRWLILHLNRLYFDQDVKFVMVACFIYSIFYSFTNEHNSYPSIIWPTFVWFFLLVSRGQKERSPEN